MDKLIIEEIAVLAAGVTILITSLAGNIWRIRQKTKEARIIQAASALLMLALLGCIFRLVCMQNGWGNSRTIFFIQNNFSLLCIEGIALMWPFYVGIHMQVEYSKLHKGLLWLSASILTLSLVLNYFLPVLFSINENGDTERYLCFYLEDIILFWYLLDGMIVFVKAKKSVGVLRTFSLVGFGIPMVVGVAVQLLRLCVNLDPLLIFMAIALNNMFSVLQNEEVICDSLTGVYNRTYLDHLQRRLGKGKGKISALMLDMNGFKQINDKYGHLEGDRALIQVADILCKAVSTHGTVIRYAGDEFVILINSQDEAFLQNLIQKIHRGFSDYNAVSGKPYHLSTSIGCSIVDMRNKTIDDLMNEIDEKMYLDKKRYYEQHSKIQEHQAFLN